MNEDGGTAGSSGAQGGGQGGSSGRGGNSGQGGGGGNNATVGVDAISDCGSSCEADVGAGRAALAAGDFATALEHYHCANTPEAAFGAGLSQLLLAVESEGATALLADLGLPQMSASALLGPDSIMSRYRERWNGTGELEVSGDVSFSAQVIVKHTTYDSEEQSESEYREIDLEAVDTASPGRFEVGLYRFGMASEFTTGTWPLQFDCTTGAAVVTSDNVPSLSVSFRHNGAGYYCNSPYNMDVASCAPDGGSLSIESAGVAVGDTASYRVDNYLLRCTVDEDDPVGGPDMSIRVTGSLSATTAFDTPTTTDLHPIFDEAWLSEIPEGTNVKDAVVHVEALSGQIAKSSCYFDLASQGTGTVFTLPGALYAGSDAGVSAGDAQILSAATALTLAAAQIAAAYEIDMPLRAVLCDENINEDELAACVVDGTCPPPEPVCYAESEVVSLFNQGFARVFHADKLSAAHDVMQAALQRLSAGIDKLDESSVLVRNEGSELSVQQFKEMTDAAITSLDGNEVAIPYLTPEILVNLQALFASPPSRDGIAADPLIYGEVCDPDFPDDCYDETSFNTEFWPAFVGSSATVDWEADDYDMGLDEDSFEELMRGLQHADIMILD